MITALKMFFFENQSVHVHILSTFPSYLSAHRIMAELEGKVSAPKRDGGRTKIHNNCEGLSEEVIDAKNLRTPPGSVESAKTRENRMQEIRRLQALRWYQYKYIIPRWEVLFAMKHPWSDITALKSSWTKDKRGPPPKNADPTTLKTEKDFPEVAEARRIAAEKREATKARKIASAQGAGPSAAPKGSKKTTRRAKKADVQSPPAASSKDEVESEEAPEEAPSKVIAKKYKKSGNKGISFREPDSVPPRATIDTTNLVTTAPLATAAPVSTRAKPSTKGKSKKAAGADDEETLAQRQDRIAQEKREKEKQIQEKELEAALLRAFEATPEEKRAEFAQKNKITHLVAAKYDAQRRLREVEDRERTPAAASAALDKIPDMPKGKATPPPKQKPADVKATKAVERKAKEALKKSKSQVVPAAQTEEDVASSNEAASSIRGDWDAAKICRILYKYANAPHEIGPDDIVPEEIQLAVNDQMIKWDEYLKSYDKAILNENFYTEAKGQDVEDEESQKFFDLKLAQAIAQQKEAQENAICINSAVRQVVSDLCLKHNDALAAKCSRKRKATGKEAGGSSAHEQEPKKRPKKITTKPVVVAPARQESPRQTTPPRVPSPPPAATEQAARVEQESVVQQVAPQVVQRRDFSPAVSVHDEDEDVKITTRSRETGPVLRIEGPPHGGGEGSKSSSGSSSGSYTSSSDEEISEDKVGQLDMARQLEEDLAAMEEEEEEHCSNPADDVVMAEPANVANQNAPPPSGQAEVV